MVLVSGASSGLGAYLAQALEASVFSRTINQPSKPGPYTAIIHCAFGMPAKDQPEQDYLQQNITLAESLLSLPHQNFIFISSIDAAEPTSPYGRAKAAVEELVQSKATNPLILRPGALLGPGMRISQLVKVARGDDIPLSLSAESTFSPVFYADIRNLITSALQNNPKGTHTVVAQHPVSLQQVAQHFGTTPQFGSFTYSTPATQTPAWQTAELHNLPPLTRLQTFIAAKGWQ